MSEERVLAANHQEGDPRTEPMEEVDAGLDLDSFAGKVHLKWVPEADSSSLGQGPFFI